MRYSRKAGAVPAPTASRRSPRKQPLSKKRPPVSSVTSPALLRRFVAHGFVLTIALLAIAASSLGIAPFNATTPETPFNPTEWPQSVSSAPLHQDRQYMIKAAVPVTESSVDALDTAPTPTEPQTPTQAQVLTQAQAQVLTQAQAQPPTQAQAQPPNASASPNPSASATPNPSAQAQPPKQPQAQPPTQPQAQPPTQTKRNQNQPQAQPPNQPQAHPPTLTPDPDAESSPTTPARLTSTNRGIVDYTVKTGDTLSGIATQFDVTTATVAWANDIYNPDHLVPGGTLRIPPTSGALHKVGADDTLHYIARRYQVDVEDIIAHPLNSFVDPNSLSLGKEIMIPGGVTPAAIPAPGSVARPGAAPVPPHDGRSLHWPTRGPILSWFNGYHRGLDISPAYGTPVYAAERGRVVLVRYLRYGYGYYLIIDHGNGYRTLYAHMSSIYVRPGSTVYRGQNIGQVGSTGRSTGPHLHFEVHANGWAVDPYRFLP